MINDVDAAITNNNIWRDTDFSMTYTMSNGLRALEAIRLTNTIVFAKNRFWKSIFEIVVSKLRGKL